MTNSTTLTNQVQEHFSSVSQNIVVISSERSLNMTSTAKAVQLEEPNAKKNSEKERRYLIEQKLSQRSHGTGYKGF